MSNPTKVRLTAVQRRAVADLLPEFRQRLKLDQQNPRVVEFTVEELKTVHEQVESARAKATSGVLRNSLQRVSDAVTKARRESLRTISHPDAARVYQFKITLRYLQPPIWRRIQVEDSTLDEFHERIQTAMGWTNSHLHQFTIHGRRYGDPDILDDGFGDFECVDSTVTKISELVPADGKRLRFLYEYDFGDGWEHEVLLERCLQAQQGERYPRCVDGERACPPEDIGGVWGYAEFVEAINDPQHEQHEEFVEWAGEFDPEEFDASQATKAMRQGLPDWRQM